MSDLKFRNNKNLKAPNAIEFIDEKEYKFRTREILKCKKDPIYFAQKYFYIISPERGKHIISLYKRQKELIRTLCKEDRVCVLASRQVGKTTAYNIFSLWTAMFYPDKAILICANTGESASDFVSRIRMAYELIPLWLKPGIKEWNKRRIKFGNDSSISALPTSPGVRGKACNCVDGKSIITLRDKETQKEFNISMENFEILLENENAELLPLFIEN